MEKMIAPSILSSDFSCLGEEIKRVEAAGADYIHIDVMDGHFVPNITIGPLIVEAVRSVTQLPLDVHLMIENPDSYIETFAKAGSSILTVHPEVCNHLHRTLSLVKGLGVKPAVALNPSTPLCSIENILEDVDMVLIMTVNPGFGGQSFIPSMLRKIEKLKEIISAQEKEIAIEVDGGITVDNIGQISMAGADIFVSGSGIFCTDDYKSTISSMKSRF